MSYSYSISVCAKNIYFLTGLSQGEERVFSRHLPARGETLPVSSHRGSLFH